MHDMQQLNNDSCIWGVDLTKTYTPIDVRDGMLTCFVHANGEMIAKMSGVQLPEEDVAKEEQLRELTAGFVRKAFAQSGGDYDHPTKVSIIAALEVLKSFAEKAHQDPAMIQKHAADIMKLAERLSD